MTRAKGYHTVAATFWNDPKVREWAEDTRSLALYLLTNPAKSFEGFYHLSPAGVSDDLGWTAERRETAWRELIATDFADYDNGARIVFIVKGLKYHRKISGAPSIKGALNALEETQGSPRLFDRFLRAATRYQPEFAAAVRSHYGLPD